MKSLTISGKLRENVGKKDTKALRKEGNVPCVLYGGNLKENIHFSVPEKSFKTLIYSPEVKQVNLEINGKEYKAMLKEAQFHPVREQLLHADFYGLKDDKKVVMAIPVKITGSSPAVIAGGKLRVAKRKLKVMGLPGDLPQEIEVSINNLGIGAIIKVGDLKSDKLQYVDPASEVLVTIKSSRTIAADAEEVEAEETSTEAAAE